MPTVLIILFAFLCAASGCLFVKAMEEENYLKATLFKGLATFFCIGVAAISLFNTKDHDFAVLIIIGLFFGFVGDEFLALRFVYPERLNTYFLSGAGSFAIGHVFYLIALFSVAPKAWIAALAINALVLVLEYISSKRNKLELGVLYVPLGAYCALVGFMGSSAIATVFTQFCIGTLFFAIAGVCFIVSDSILSVQSFSDHPSNGKNRTLHALYWTAQFLIALSPIFIK